jgi:hypothetical protein
MRSAKEVSVGAEFRTTGAPLTVMGEVDRPYSRHFDFLAPELTGVIRGHAPRFRVTGRAGV